MRFSDADLTVDDITAVRKVFAEDETIDPGWGVSVDGHGNLRILVPEDGVAYCHEISYDEAVMLVALLRAVTE